MFAARALVAFAGLTMACSGSSAGSDTTPETPRAHGTQAADEAAEGAAAPPLARADCAELVAHIVDVAVREDAAQRPNVPSPTDDELAAMREALFEELKDDCVGRPRSVYDCAMRAQTTREIQTCDDATG